MAFDFSKPAEHPEQEKTIPYWPYCTTCRKPYDFDEDQPFAHCDCGTQEWGYPRPENWIPRPFAGPLEVRVERGRVWLVRAHQSFMLAYDDPENTDWYANQLRKALGLPEQ